MKRIYKFKGTSKEIGEKIGFQYKKWGLKEVYIPKFAQIHLDKQLSVYEKYFPSYLEQLEGVAKGLSLPKDKVITSYLTGFLANANNKPYTNCSEVLICNKNGIYVGSNYDWRQASESCSALMKYSFTDSSSYNFTGISDMGTWKLGAEMKKDEFLVIVEDAWNEKGLYVGLNGVAGEIDDYGMSTPHLVQACMEQCKNTEEATKLIEKVPLNESKIFIVADENGNIAIVEKVSNKEVRIRRDKKLLITTNHYNHPDLIKRNSRIFDDIPFHSTFARYHYLESNLKNDYQNINSKSLIGLLKKPPALQNWRSKASGDAVTIWSLVLNLKTGKFEVIFSPLNKRYIYEYKNKS